MITRGPRRRVVVGAAAALWLVLSGTVLAHPSGEPFDDARWLAPLENRQVSDAQPRFEYRFEHSTPGGPGIEKVEYIITQLDGATNVPACVHNVDPYLAGGAPEVQEVIPLTFRCNGTYRVVAAATTFSNGTHEAVRHTIAREIVLKLPVGPPSSLEAETKGDRSVTVSWNPPENPPPDIVGYRVERSSTTEGPWEIIGRSNGLTFVDRQPADNAGEQTWSYRALTLRSGPDDTEIVSSPSNTWTSVIGADSGQPAGPDPGAPPPSGQGGGGPVATQAPPSTGALDFDPGFQTIPRREPPTTLDTGFTNELPFEITVPLGTEPPQELADGGQATVALPNDDGGGGPNLFLPIVGATVLTAAAIQMLVLVRRASITPVGPAVTEVVVDSRPGLAGGAFAKLRSTVAVSPDEIVPDEIVPDPTVPEQPAGGGVVAAVAPTRGRRVLRADRSSATDGVEDHDNSEPVEEVAPAEALLASESEAEAPSPDESAPPKRQRRRQLRAR